MAQSKPFKRREWELGETKVLEGTIKNRRLLAIYITGLGWAIWHTIQLNFFLLTTCYFACSDNLERICCQKGNTT